MKSKFLTFGFAVSALLTAVSAQASESAYLTLTGQRQGVFKGGTVEKGREGSTAVFGFEQAITSPRDPQSGLPTGKRMATPLTLDLALDKATPEFYSALSTNENLTDVTLKLWQTTAIGTEGNIFTIKLTNATISAIKLVRAIPENATAVGERVSAHLEVSFTYQKIQWTWNDGGVTASDDWTTAH